MAISGRVNVYPAEIEAVLLTIPGADDGAVFGVPDAEFGETVCAHVQVAPCEPDSAAIRGGLAASLGEFKLPKMIEIATLLPREDYYKMFKRTLREPCWAGTGRAV